MQSTSFSFAAVIVLLGCFTHDLEAASTGSGFEPCAINFPAPDASFQRRAESSFSLPIPTNWAEEIRFPILDHTAVTWTWLDGRVVLYQFGFATDSVEDWLTDPTSNHCITQLDQTADIVYFERQSLAPDAPYEFAIMLYQYPVKTFTWGFWLGDYNTPIDNELLIYGKGLDATIFDQGRMLVGGFKWSRMPTATFDQWLSTDPVGTTLSLSEPQLGQASGTLTLEINHAPYVFEVQPGLPVVSSLTPDETQRLLLTIPIKIIDPTNGASPELFKANFEDDDVIPPLESYWADAEFSIFMDGAANALCNDAHIRWQRPHDPSTQYFARLSRLNGAVPIEQCDPYRTTGGASVRSQ